MRDRIDRLYMRATGSPDARGSLTWLARELGVAWHTVWCWAVELEDPRTGRVAGPSRPHNRHVRLIESAVDAGVYDRIRLPVEEEDR